MKPEDKSNYVNQNEPPTTSIPNPDEHQRKVRDECERLFRKNYSGLDPIIESRIAKLWFDAYSLGRESLLPEIAELKTHANELETAIKRLVDKLRA